MKPPSRVSASSASSRRAMIVSQLFMTTFLRGPRPEQSPSGPRFHQTILLLHLFVVHFLRLIHSLVRLGQQLIDSRPVARVKRATNAQRDHAVGAGGLGRCVHGLL